MRNVLTIGKKAFGLFLMLFVVFSTGILGAPTQAHAQAIVSTPASDTIAINEQIRNATDKTVFGAVVGSVTTSLINIMTYFANNFAHDAAVLVASGGNADQPLFERRPVEDYFIYAGANVANEVLNVLNENNIKNGQLTEFSVCAPPNLGSLRAGIASNFKRQDLEVCGNLDSLKSNWSGFFATVQENISDPSVRNQTILNTFSQTIDPNVNDFTVSMSVFTRTLLAADVQSSWSAKSLLAKDGVWDVTDFVTGQVTTPSAFVTNYYYDANYSATQLPAAIGASLIANSDALVQVGLSATSVFTNTLLSELTQKLADGLFAPTTLDQNPFDEFASGASSRDAALTALRSLQTFQPLDVTNYNLLSDLSSCPSGVRGVSRKLYNCVIDTNFATVLGRAGAGDTLTLKQAIDEGLINGGWPLIPETDKARDQDQNCYQYAFCHSNLVKLRKARIIPIGWELATQLPEAAGSSLTLKQVMDGFTDCNSNNQRDGAHPFCHLVDPNWVLKMPESSCRILAYGETLQSAGSSIRSEECVDLQSCIAEGDNGECLGGYGYCVREKNVWQFRGDSCPEYAASCLSFTSSAGEQANFLSTSVNQDGCNADNAGCAWYQVTKESTAGAAYDWPVITDVAAVEAAPAAFRDRAYFNGSVAKCGQGDDGCTQLVEKQEGLTLNQIVNGTFQEDQNGDGFPDAWLTNNYSNVLYDTTSTVSRTGTSSINPKSSLVYQPGIILQTGSFYTLSFYARQVAAGGSNSARVMVQLSSVEGTPANFAFTSYDTDNCRVFDADGDGINESIGVNAQPTDTGYERFSCLFTVPTFTTSENDQAVGFVAISSPNNDIWVDDLMLENTTTPSTWANGYSQSFGDLAMTYLRLPPSYLGCDGSATQPEECNQYAQICSEADAGCTLYTPTNGDPEVAGVVNELDRCDADCAGYDTYKQEPTRYEPNGDFPVYFIPDTADSCRAEAVGCDEFTNLTTENQEYFTYLRACVTDTQAAGQQAVFYTWEGSDVEGYQLRTWDLLESNIASVAPYTYTSGFEEQNLGNAPCTNWTASVTGITCVETLSDVSIPNPDACDEHDDIFNNPDCREFYDANGDIHYRDWRDTVTVDNACVSYRKTELAGLGNDLNTNGTDDGAENCQQSGGYFNASTNACIYYGFADQSATCSVQENGCREYTGGQSRNSRVVLDDNLEFGLTNWNASSATAVTLSNESIATDGHSLKSTGSSTVKTYLYDNGGDCTTTGGCSSTTGALGGSCVVIEGQRYCGVLENDLFQGKTYTLTFWAKGNGNLDVGFDFLSTPSSTIDAYFGNNVALEPEWKRYSLGPLNMTAGEFPDFGAGTTLSFDPDGATEFYIDNIVLREGETNITVIRDSWVTPAQCDENAAGVVSPQYQLGCQEYTDQRGNVNYLKSFSKLCGEDKVGCTAYFNTSNSDSVSGEIRNATCSTIDGLPASSTTACYLQQSGGAYDTSSQRLCDIAPGNTSCQFDLDYFLQWAALSQSQFAHISYQPDARVVQSDHITYAVYSSSFTCSQGVQGCREVGVPTFSADQSKVNSWETKYLIDDPDTYDDTLCHAENLFCEEWSDTDSNKWYFKNPEGQTCEYKTNVTISGQQYDGWFRSGTTDFCYGTGTCSNTGSACSTDSQCATSAEPDAVCQITSGDYVVSGVTSGLWRNGDTAYDGWVGTCAAEQNGCSEFQDPLDFADSEFYGQTDGAAYFFKNNDNLQENTLISSERCNGQVSQRDGCVLFNNTGDTSSKYNASASLIASQHADNLFGQQQFSLVNPINCDTGNSVITTPSGQTVDLCARRCVYRNNKLDSSFKRANTTSVYDIFSVDGSCYEDTDCSPKESDTGDLVQGNCVEVLNDPQGSYPSQSVPRLENDTNLVLKVNRDRVCSEWLAQTDVRPVWDASINKYRSISSGLELCRSFTGEGDTTSCSDIVVDDPAVVLDVNRYTSRDVTWYGEEYSGYAVPDIYPIQLLTQVNIAPQNVCFTAAGEATTRACETNSDCSINVPSDPNDDESCGGNPVNDYRLGYNAGECSAPNGQSCTVGYCSGNGFPCSDNAQCQPDAGQCVTGQCLLPTTTGITAANACAPGEVYISGTCYADRGFCDDGANDNTLDGTCGGGATCFQSVATKQGSCYRDSCILSVSGDSFDVQVEETQVCRAYPEQDSPYNDDLVATWVDGDGVTGDANSSLGYAPYSTVSGFDSANFCAPGETCSCSYKKLSAASGSPAYTAVDTDPDGAGYNGICSAGSAAGALCNVDADCGSDTDSVPGPDNGAKCTPLDRVDSVYGLPGFCLERDTGVNIQGNPDLGACVTWLPIDELQGTTDLYAKYSEAGYFDDTYYCGEVRGYSNIETMTGGCAEIRGSDGSGNTRLNATQNNSFDCQYTVACPDGWMAIAGRAKTSQSNTSQAAEACTTAVNSCPFMCVPPNSFHDNGEMCDTPAAEGQTYAQHHTAYYTPTSVWIADWFDTDTLFNHYRDCTMYGEENGTGIFQTMLDFPQSHDYNGSAPDEYYGLVKNFKSYPSCDSLVKVSDADGQGYAFTDRVLNPANTHSVSVGSFTYLQGTAQKPFGASITPVDAATQNADGIADPTPAVIPSCIRTGSDEVYIPTLDLDPNSCPQGYEMNYGTEPAPEARSFLDWQSASGSYGSAIGTTEGFGNITARLQTIFAKPLRLFDWTPGTNYSIGGDGLGAYDTTGSELSSGDSLYWDVRTLGHAPVVKAINSDKCYGSLCEEGPEDAITVNGQNSGNQLSESGFLRSTIEFFAFADKDQLPIRRVIIEWGDELGGGDQSGSKSPNNFYKNHRGLITGQKTTTNCDGSEWGKTEASCDASYLTYSHAYTCSVAEAAATNTQWPDCVVDAAGKLASSPCKTEINGQRACGYQPRVHVRDNWGWCTGTCTGDGSGNPGCFENDVDTLNDTSSDLPRAECAYQNFPSATHPENDPWVYYDGVIYVTP